MSDEVLETRAAQWQRVRGKMLAEFGDGVFRSWLKPMVLANSNTSSVTISVPTRFMRDRVNAIYGDRLRALWSAEKVDTVELVVASDLAQTPVDAELAEQQVATSPTPHRQDSMSSTTGANGAEGVPGEDTWFDEIGAPLDPRLTFENFVIGKPNEFAYAACRRVADASEVAFNPLFLYGPVGMGKTHLMHAVAWHIRKRDPSRRVLYISAETFMYRFIRAVRFRDQVAFKEQFRSVDVLMVDDVQFICGKESTQDEFFHTFNALVDKNRQIIISADKSPSDLEGLEERLRSRLGWGLVADLHPTDYELRLSIVEAKAGQMGLEIPKSVMEFLAHRIPSNVRELEGALNRLVAHAQLVGRELTVEATQDLLRDVLRANDRRVTIEDIQRRVAEHYNIRLADMASPRRARAVARPRQIAMYLAKQLTTRSLPEIGRKFGGRDHTTVMHAVRKVDELRSSDQLLQEDLDRLRRSLEN
ncbi:MAG TPA: chromosomal replication initiator protein DnaA [Alphaproteobacteria bacterium]|nr:chromosomal replication initiator protein DnaA [Alphaproteobacteria bacterium]